MRFYPYPFVLIGDYRGGTPFFVAGAGTPTLKLPPYGEFIGVPCIGFTYSIRHCSRKLGFLSASVKNKACAGLIVSPRLLFLLIRGWVRPSCGMTSYYAPICSW